MQNSSNKGTKLKAKWKLNCEKPAPFTDESLQFAGEGGRRGDQLLMDLNFPHLCGSYPNAPGRGCLGLQPLPPVSGPKKSSNVLTPGEF